MTAYSPYPALAAAVAASLLAGCDAPGGDASQAAPAGLPIACALDGGPVEAGCRVERARTSEGIALTVHHPDGGFRRLLVAEDGSGVTAADGAEPAVVRQVSPQAIEVTIGSARYRLPARAAAKEGA